MAQDHGDCPPNNNVRRLVDKANMHNIPVVICADANSHHSIWGSSDTNTRDVKHISDDLMIRNKFVKIINSKRTLNIYSILTYEIHAKTSIIVQCKCKGTENLLLKISEGRFFNKTYNWILLDEDGICQHGLLQADIQYLGPNAQITHVKFNNSIYEFSDFHSKGRHLGAPLEIISLAKAYKIQNSSDVTFIEINPFSEVHSMKFRDNFNGLTLRGASVIDQENITSTNQIIEILSRASKDVGVSAFSKYHFELSEIIRERLNFTVNYRNARGWAGKLENSTFRLGYIGIMQRNEADIGASASYNRINRFAYFDIIQQSWKLETSFLFRFTPNLNVHNQRGNFLAPFQIHVWIVAFVTFLTLIIIWICIEYSVHCLKNTSIYTGNYDGNLYAIPLNVIAVICQQGLDPIPKGISSRIITITTFIFSLVMYNYYTSSVVGGLLSNTAQGPASVDEIISSELRLSFEDIGYYKILFRENKSPRIVRLLNRKVLPPRDSNDLPVFTHIEDAIPYLKRGGYAFHCEVVDAYPEIAKQFEASEICDLRAVSGLLVTELLNSVVNKNSQYTELFRVIMIRARETGLVKRLLLERQPKKPKCQDMYTVYPVNFAGIADAFILLAVGIFISLLAIFGEMYYRQFREKFILLNNRLHKHKMKIEALDFGSTT
ncbi:ionotropic receptor 75a [Lucilia sericata]|uniref:ionotropic receptor 75a n=1 Tax=Lucilia sericata TaxID=13632 RepID=UPI0018A82F66|nr:ionotropic receptor 75a [Lucilia sericata]